MIMWMLWSTVFALIVVIATLATERVTGAFGAARRHVWATAMVLAAVVPPILASLQPREAAPGVPARSATSFDAPAVYGPAVATGARLAFAPTAAFRRPPRNAHIPADRWALALWACASIALAMVFARSVHTLRRASLGWTETELGRHTALIAPHAGPAVIGFVHPRIVIPEWTLTLDARVRELMLIHETEHVRAGDPRTLLAAGMILVVFPWNAALWLIVRGLRRAIEIDCDARVIRTVGGAADYGMMLIAVGERHAASLPLATSLSAPQPLLEQRIKVMTTPRPRRPLVAAVPFVAVALASMIAAVRAPRPAPLDLIAHRRPVTATVAVTSPAPAPGLVAPKQSYTPAAATRPSATRPSATRPSATRPSATPRAAATMPAQVPPQQVADAIDRETIVALVAAHHPDVLRGEVRATYIVMLFDANDNYLWSVPGSGSAMIAVWGDPLGLARRRALKPQQPNSQRGDGMSGGGGRGGRGAGGSSGSGGATARDDSAIFGDFTAAPAHPSGAYLTGVTAMSAETMVQDAGGKSHVAINDARGLVRPSDGASGIDGIPAAQIMFVDTYRFGAAELGAPGLSVVAAHLVPGAVVSAAARTDVDQPAARHDTVDTVLKKPATVSKLVILPLPKPPGYSMEACFSVAADGQGRLLQYTTTTDTAYKRKLETALRSYRFKPATRGGAFVVDTICVRAK